MQKQHCFTYAAPIIYCTRCGYVVRDEPYYLAVNSELFTRTPECTGAAEEDSPLTDKYIHSAEVKLWRDDRPGDGNNGLMCGGLVNLEDHGFKEGQLVRRTIILETPTFKTFDVKKTLEEIKPK